MEQGEVAVARAGICATLPARTSVLAAANPVGGRWNRAKTVQQNLGLSAPMLSRFDLIFVMRDAPDAALDQRLSEHVLALHSGESAKENGLRPFSDASCSPTSDHFQQRQMLHEGCTMPFANASAWRSRAAACRSCPLTRTEDHAISA